MTKINVLVFLRKFIGFLIPVFLIGSLLLALFSFFQEPAEESVQFSDIAYIESSDGYVHIYTVDKERKFIGESFQKVQEKYPKLLPVRKKACLASGCKISVNPEYACYSRSTRQIHLAYWDKSILPGRGLLSLIEYNLDVCAEEED